MAIFHQKYPNFRGSLESADHRSSNTYNETKRKNKHLDKPLLCTQKTIGRLQPCQQNLIHENVPDPPPAPYCPFQLLRKWIFQNPKNTDRDFSRCVKNNSLYTKTHICTSYKVIKFSFQFCAFCLLNTMLNFSRGFGFIQKSRGFSIFLKILVNSMKRI